MNRSILKTSNNSGKVLSFEPSFTMSISDTFFAFKTELTVCKMVFSSLYAGITTPTGGNLDSTVSSPASLYMENERFD